MTSISLAQRFQEARAPKIEVDGQEIYGLYEIELSSDVWVSSLDFISYRESTIQGVKIKAVNCDVKVNDQFLSDFCVWADCSPRHIPLDVAVKKGRKASLKVWNVWKHDDVSHAWIGNAGMLVREKGGHIVFYCSDGRGEPVFDDLVFSIEVHKAVK